MPYTIPTSADLLARYPEFAEVPPELVERIISDASLFVDTSWYEIDYQPAIMALASYMLSVLPEAAPADAGGTTAPEDVQTFVQSVKINNRTVTYGVASKAAASAAIKTGAEAFAASPYGELYLRLLRRNSPMVLVV